MIGIGAGFKPSATNMSSEGFWHELSFFPEIWEETPGLGL